MISQDYNSQYGGLDKVPYYLLQPVQALVVGDTTVATSARQYVPGEDLTFVVTLDYPNFTPDIIEHAVVSGGEYTDVLLSRHVPEKLLTAVNIRLSAISYQLSAGIGNLSELKAESLQLMAYLMALGYYRMVFKNQDKLEQYLGMVFPALTVDSFSMKRLSVLYGWFGEPVSVSEGPWGVDIIRTLVPPRSVTGSGKYNKLALDLLLNDSSVMEHRVIEDVNNEAAVSAVKIMHLSAAQGIELYLADETNWEDLKLFSLHQPEDFLMSIEDLINQGNKVYVPGYPIQLGGWRGSAYIGGGSYIISGGFASGAPVAMNGGEGSGAPGVGSGSGDCSCPSCCPTAGSSQVNLAVGNFTFTETDLSVNARGLPAVLSRTYNSIKTTDLGLGAGWGWSYGSKAAEDVDGSVTLTREDGITKVFTTDGQGGYVNPSGMYDTLTKTPSGFTLSSKGDIRQEFGLDGKFLSMSEPNGNTVTVAYANGLPSKVTDAAGRTVLTFQNETVPGTR